MGSDLDLVIINGRVIDPESRTDAVLNVGIRGSRIVSVTADDMSASRVIDAQGKLVSPGFIDMHAHGQNILSGRVQALDGVTTALELEAGVWPVNRWYAELAKEGRPINYGASVNWAFARVDALLGSGPEGDDDWLTEQFAGAEWQAKLTSDSQLDEIMTRVQQGLDQGGLGIGFLLGYAPDVGRKEYFHLTDLAARNEVPTFTHARYLSMLEPDSSFEAMAEIVAAAAGTGAHAHIVHLNSISLRDIGPIGRMISSARDQGVRLSTEAYPYGAGSTHIGAAMFRQENWQEKIGGITAHNFDVNGARLEEAEFERLQSEAPETGVVVHLLDTAVPEDQAFLDQSVLFPGGVIASDGGDWSLDGKPVESDTWPLPEKAWSHPRSAGTYARFLRNYVVERNTLSWLDAIERVSYGPARLLEAAVPQMQRKGRIQVGADADIVIIDPVRVTDNATYTAPAQTSSGINYVIVNGQVLVENGELDTDVLPGKAIRNDQPSQSSGEM
ncbi:amidohydrolase family protein [Parahaliea aestuarii]